MMDMYETIISNTKNIYIKAWVKAGLHLDEPWRTHFFTAVAVLQDKYPESPQISLCKIASTHHTQLKVLSDWSKIIYGGTMSIASGPFPEHQGRFGLGEEAKNYVNKMYELEPNEILTNKARTLQDIKFIRTFWCESENFSWISSKRNRSMCAYSLPLKPQQILKVAKALHILFESEPTHLTCSEDTHYFLLYAIEQLLACEEISRNEFATLINNMYKVLYPYYQAENSYTQYLQQLRRALRSDKARELIECTYRSNDGMSDRVLMCIMWYLWECMAGDMYKLRIHENWVSDQVAQGKGLHLKDRHTLTVKDVVRYMRADGVDEIMLRNYIAYSFRPYASVFTRYSSNALTLKKDGTNIKQLCAAVENDPCNYVVE